MTLQRGARAVLVLLLLVGALLPVRTWAASALHLVVAENLRPCGQVPVALVAVDGAGTVDSGYRGRVVLNAGIPGNWVLDGGSGALEFPAADGQAAYTFSAADAGRARLAFLPATTAAFAVTADDGNGLATVSRNVAAPLYDGTSIAQGVWESRQTWTTNQAIEPAQPLVPNLATADALQLVPSMHVDSASHGSLSKFTINWTGTLRVPQDGQYIVHIDVNEGARVLLDAAPVIDEWSFYDWRRGTAFASAPRTLHAGVEYDITVLYFERWGPPLFNIRLERVGDPLGAQPIPATDLHACTSALPNITAPIAWYKMDEAAWSGAAADVRDSIGGRHAVAGGGMAPTNAVPALAGTPGTCGYGTVPVDGTLGVHAGLQTGINLANDVGSSGTISFWYRNPTAWNSGTYRTLLDASESSAAGKLFYLGINVNGGVLFNVRQSNGTDQTYYSWTTYTIPAGQWVQVVLRWDLVARVAYFQVNDTSGAVIGNVTQWSLATNIVSPSATLVIGDNATSVTNGAWPSWWSPTSGGDIDEVRVFQGALANQEVAVLPRFRHRCGSADHFALLHAGSAVNCEAAAVTLEVHAEDHTLFSAYTGTATFATSTDHGDWSLAAGAGAFANAGNGAATYTFVAADGGRARFRLRDAYPEPMSINVSDGTIAEPATEDDVLEFVRAGFVVSSDDPSGEVPLQLTGKDSDTGYKAASIFLKAIRTDDDTGACASLFNGSVNIATRLVCNAPAACGAANGSVNGTALVAAASPIAVAVPFAFDATSRAPLVLSYSGAGKLQMAFEYALDSDNKVSGASNVFVVRPFALVPEVPGNPAATDAGGGVLARAGRNFKARVRAVSWQAADDIDNNGIADGHDDTDITNNADLSDNLSVSNYGLGGALQETALLAARIAMPSGGASPALAGATEFSAFGAGLSAEQDVHFDDVGVIELRVRLKAGSYFGLSAAETNRLSGVSGPVGRFRADHLVTEMVHHGCSDPDAFSYSGQPFAELKIHALNAAGGTLANYHWDSLAASGFAKDVSLSDASASSPGSFVNGGISRQDFSSGGITLSDVAFAFAGPRLPYALMVRATDSDGATSKDYGEGASSIRAARLVIDRAFSPNFIPASASIRVETWQWLSAASAGWDIEPADTCTSLALPGGVWLDQYTDAVNSGNVVPSGLSISSGAGRLDLTAPGTGNNGSVRATLNAPDWLKFDWNGTGAENPAAIIRYFELYRDEPGVISRGETY